MREKILWLHRWLGLTAGIVFAIASGTGAVLVYQTPLDLFLAGPRFEATAGEQSPAAIEAAVRAARPGSTIRSLTWLPGGENVIRVDLEEAGRGSVIWLDNGSGRLVQPRPVLLVLRAVRALHTNLMIGRPGGRIVTWASAAAVVTILLSLYLWWPGLRKLWQGFRIRFRRGAYLLNFDLHQALGILAVPLLLFGSVTGVFMRYGGRAIDRIERTVHGPAPETGWGEVRSSVLPDGSTATLSLERIVNAARSVRPEDRLVAIRMPAAPDGVVEVEFATAGSPAKVALDHYTGAVLAQHTDPVPFRYNRQTNEQLHAANLGGPVFDLLYMLSCAIGFMMLPTGVTMWWLKRTRLAESARRRAGARAERAERV